VSNIATPNSNGATDERIRNMVRRPGSASAAASPKQFGLCTIR